MHTQGTSCPTGIESLSTSLEHLFLFLAGSRQALFFAQMLMGRQVQLSRGRRAQVPEARSCSHTCQLTSLPSDPPSGPPVPLPAQMSKWLSGQGGKGQGRAHGILTVTLTLVLFQGCRTFVGLYGDGTMSKEVRGGTLTLSPNQE